jgi:hypothetical protein
VRLFFNTNPDGSVKGTYPDGFEADVTSCFEERGYEIYVFIFYELKQNQL